MKIKKFHLFVIVFCLILISGFIFYNLQKEKVSLMFVGDIMLSRSVAKHVEKNEGGDFTFPFKKTAEILKKADIAFGNLESPISTNGQPADKKYLFRSHPDVIEGLEFSNLDIVSLANNHIVDYGHEALNDTLQYLDQTDIKASGILQNTELSQKPIIFTKKGTQIGYLSYVDLKTELCRNCDNEAFEDYPYSPAFLQQEKLIEDIKNLTKKVDIVIVSIHTGQEYKSYPNLEKKELSRSLIDAGANIVIGHHPHYFQPIERYNDGVICYSLGNFVFDQHTRPKTRFSNIVQIEVENKKIGDVSVLPIWINENWQPTPQAVNFEEIAKPIALSSIFVAKIILAFSALILIWLYFHFRKKTNLKKILVIILSIIALFATYSFYNFQSQNLTRVGYWDFYHYYLNSKYSDELGYFDLYEATLVADLEANNLLKDVKQIRDQKTQQYMKSVIGPKKSRLIKENFSPERWEEFKNDIGFFLARVKNSLWGEILKDRGYNASPVWDKTGSLLANTLPIENPSTIPILISFDFLLLIATVVLIFYAFGIIPALLFLIFLGTNPLKVVPLWGSFLRLDWLMTLIASACLVKLKHYKTAGATLAYSAMSRIFPIIFLGGMLCKTGWEFIRTKKISPVFRKFFLGFFVTFLALFLYGSLDRENNFDFRRWQNFGEKITIHSQAYSTQRSGLGYLFSAENTELKIVIGVLIIILFIIATRKISIEKLIPFSFILLPVFVSLPSYYFVVITILALFFYDPARKKDAIGISLILTAFIIQALKTNMEGALYNTNTSYSWSILVILSSLGVLIISISTQKQQSHIDH